MFAHFFMHHSNTVPLIMNWSEILLLRKFKIVQQITSYLLISRYPFPNALFYFNFSFSCTCYFLFKCHASRVEIDTFLAFVKKNVFEPENALEMPYLTQFEPYLLPIWTRGGAKLPYTLKTLNPIPGGVWSHPIPGGVQFCTPLLTFEPLMIQSWNFTW